MFNFNYYVDLPGNAPSPIPCKGIVLAFITKDPKFQLTYFAGSPRLELG